MPTTPTIKVEDAEDASSSISNTPRQSGSMVMHHDDVVTRMKNIDMIELGRHRIRPWYFAPYPQVRVFQISQLLPTTELGANQKMMYIVCMLE